MVVRDTCLCPLPKSTKRQRITKEVGGRRRRQRIKSGGGPGGQEAVAREKVEAATQQPVMADDKRQQQDGRLRLWQTGGGGVMRCDAKTSQDG